MVSLRRNALSVPCSQHSSQGNGIPVFSRRTHLACPTHFALLQVAHAPWKTNLHLSFLHQHANKERTLLPVDASEPLRRQTHALLNSCQPDTAHGPTSSLRLRQTSVSVSLTNTPAKRGRCCQWLPLSHSEDKRMHFSLVVRMRKTAYTALHPACYIL